MIFLGLLTVSTRLDQCKRPDAIPLQIELSKACILIKATTNRRDVPCIAHAFHISIIYIQPIRHRKYMEQWDRPNRQTSKTQTSFRWISSRLTLYFNMIDWLARQTRSIDHFFIFEVGISDNLLVSLLQHLKPTKDLFFMLFWHLSIISTQ